VTGCPRSFSSEISVWGGTNAFYWIFAAACWVWVLAEVITLLANPKRRAVHDFIAGTVVEVEELSTWRPAKD